MSEKFHEMLTFALVNEVGLAKGKAKILAAYFANVEEFLQVEETDLRNLRSIFGGRPIRLTADEITRILEFKSLGHLSPQLTVAENFLACISRDFTKRQLTMIRSITMASLNPNPFLIRALNLDSPADVVQINVYMAVTRSIVTSMGFFIQNILLSSSENVENAPRNSGWDLIKITNEGERSWLQIKSSPNNMDKDQIVYWARKIQDKINEGDQAYIGITYGKRTNQTVTLGLLRQLLPDWQMRTLIGRELWDFLSEDPDYTSMLLETLRNSASQVLRQGSIASEIDACVHRITDEFIRQYGEGSEGISNYINYLF
jgi:hypothetical protein